jgi:hypothetical protein
MRCRYVIRYANSAFASGTFKRPTRAMSYKLNDLITGIEREESYTASTDTAFPPQNREIITKTSSSVTVIILPTIRYGVR